jgi:hypothetical protein
VRPNVDGDQTIGKVSKPAMEVWSPWQTAHARRCLPRCWPGSPPRLAQLTPPRPPGRGGPPPLALVRLDAVGAVILDWRFRGMAKGREHWHAPVGDRRTKDRLSDGQRAFNRVQAGLRALVEQAIGQLASAWALRRWRGLLYSQAVPGRRL